MKVSGHSLKHNKGSSRPQRMLFFDTETTSTHIEGQGERQDLKLVTGHYWKRQNNGKADTHEWSTFTESAPFLDWMLSKVTRTHKLIVTSHNLGFDMPVMGIFGYFANRGWTVRGFYEKYGTRIIRFGRDDDKWAEWQESGKPREDFKGRKTHSSIVFVDNHNFFRGTLASWGEVIGHPKMEIDFETCTDEELREYCKNDVMIMVKLWSWYFDFLTTHDLGAWKHTVPAQAFTAFRHRFMPCRIWIHHHPVAEELARQAYKGGICEALRVGTFTDGPYYKLDVNSMYPYVMRNREYPRDLAAVTEGKSVRWLKRAIKGRCIIAEVLVRVPKRYFPVRMNGKNCYPVGRYWTTLTTPELELALSRGWVRKVGRIAAHRKSRIFVDYIDFFYSLKERYTHEGNNSLRKLTKLFLNTLYGKWGQLSQGLEPIDTCDSEEYAVYPTYNAESGIKQDYYKIGGTVFQQGEKEEGYNSYPAIAAHVTAEARLYLLSLIDRAGRKNVYYCDTDSVIVNHRGYAKLQDLMDDSELGALKLEGVSESLTIHGRKDYVFDGHVTLKGIRSSADKVGPNKYKQVTFPSILGGMRRFGKEMVIVYETVKVLTRVVDWGNLRSGGHVTPYCIGDTHHSMEEEKLRSELEAWRDSCLLPSQVVFKFWDYKAGDFRRQRDKRGQLTIWAYAKTDDVATEQGYTDDEEFLQAVKDQAKAYKHIRRIERQLRDIGD